jgi:Zn-dependent peptidase ImmA (M78 family)
MAGGHEHGSRIKELRSLRGLKAEQLAADVGLSASAMSRLEHGERAVKASELVDIAASLDVSPLAILFKDSRLGRLATACVSAQSGVRAGAGLSRLNAIAELDHVFTANGHPHESALDSELQALGGGVRLGAAELASWFVEEHLDPLSGTGGQFQTLLDAIQKRLKIDVLVERFDNDPLIGAAWLEGEFPFIIINARNSMHGCLFALAHALGHIMGPNASPLVVDYVLKLEHQDDPGERFANDFAAEVLMPASSIDRIIDREGGLDASAVASMLVEFGVGLNVLLYRLNGLRKVGDKGSNRLRQLGVSGLLRALRGWSKGTRNLRLGLIMGRTVQTPTSQPYGLMVRAGKAWDEGVVGIGQLATLLDEDLDLLLDSFESADDGMGDVDYSNLAEVEGSMRDQEAMEGVDYSVLDRGDESELAHVSVENCECYSSSSSSSI